jgi:D-serine deaminase-like pyridoxal phosphate-dependent protein
MLYAGRVDKARALDLLGALEGVAVLTVSDLDTFTQLGGTASFFVDDENRMRFIVNVDSARRSKVQLSAQLLRLATLVTSK